MSSTSTSLPQTPPDLFINDAVKVAYSHPALGTLDEVPAVGESRPEVTESGLVGATTESLEIGRKDAALDPLILAAAISSGPHVSRHHYHHSFFPSAEDVEAHAWEWSDGQRIISRQVPRNIRLGGVSESSYEEDSSRSSSVSPYLKPTDAHGKPALLPPLNISHANSTASSESDLSSSPISTHSSELVGFEDEDTVAAVNHKPILSDVTVKCMVRTRVPTPHGEVFLHLYHNDRDNKEHLAIVIDPAQLDQSNGDRIRAPSIRSKSLDSIWHEGETPMERVTRGAYVGRLSEAGFTASDPIDSETNPRNAAFPAPLVRIHSECFTGETIGSMRCDCGEQLDEALRRISQPIVFTDPMTGESATIPGRGAVIYMRQEGRGIGLLSKLRAYNLQDLGHDTVQANLLLGHEADERGYEVAAAIMHDLGLGSRDATSAATSEGVRLLTNNPDKVEKLAEAGVHISEQVPMVPRTWRCQAEAVTEWNGKDVGASLPGDEEAARLRSAGATLIGAGATHGPELEKYLRTKVLRMGHMLSLPPSEPTHV